ncbi:NAD-dependent dehydratase [Sorangium cellulosum]|uniref:NAD-dependent dehydratase n=1 Tax=Sorangium cellulosum TaxID=56 RepID=A0A2L0F4Y0_SORCE|nr:UDP-glucuronic acid decarboxylase family protein [Sorangium cellulosum]AUX46602.1 NAD-dependent dehydratase [Sorangium cellulosum]
MSAALRILVTGGAGFVGSHLCDRLIRDGHEVIALDDFSTGSDANVAHLLHHRRFRLVEHDVTQPYDFKVDRIYNLASPASPPHYQRDPVRTTLVNVVGAFHALKLAESCGARVFQASTSEVYGDPEVHPQPESYRGYVNPVGIRSCYDEGKRCAESLVMDFHRRHGVEVRLARIFNTYGPRMALDDGRVVSNFIVQALRGEDLTVYGDGSQTRSFCYVDDLIEGIVRLMEHPTEIGPVNLGNPEEFTVLELAEEVIHLTGSRSRIEYRPLPADDPRQRQPVIEHAKRALGFEPKVPLRVGLRRTIEGFRGVLGLGRHAAALVTSEGDAPLPQAANG